jgi:ABC-type glycerol-3-phosphate transport system substrate-binding protein
MNQGRSDRRISRRQFLRVAAGAGSIGALTIVLAGCAPGSQAPAAAPAAPAAPAAEATKAPEAQAPAGGAGGELRFIKLAMAEPVAAYFNGTAIPEFEKANPGLKVKVDMSDWDHLGEKLLTSFAGNIPVDLVETGSDWVGPYAKRGQFMAIDNFVADYKEISDYYPRMVDISKYQGKLMALPYVLDIRTMCYRKDFFKDAGFDPEKSPDNWDELVQYATKLVQKDAQGDITRAGYMINATRPADAFFEFWYLLVQNGSGVVMPWESWDPQAVAFNGPEGVEALTFMNDLINKHKVTPITGVSSKVPNLSSLAQGVAAMVVTNSAEVGNWKQYQPDKLGVLGIGVPLNKKKRLTYACPNVYAIGTNTKQPQQSWLLMKHMVSEPIMTGILGPDNASPPRMSVAKNADYMKDPMLAKFQEIPAKGWGDTTPQATDFPTLEIIGNYVQSVLRGEMQAKAALDKAAEEVKKKIVETNA